MAQPLLLAEQDRLRAKQRAAEVVVLPLVPASGLPADGTSATDLAVELNGITYQACRGDFVVRLDGSTCLQLWNKEGRVVRREGDPLEIFTDKDGEVIFKKYSLMGGVDEFAAQLCDTLSKSTGTSVAVTDRDSVIAAAGSARRDLIGKRISPQLEQIMEDRGIYRAVPSERSVFVTESLDRYCATIAAPIISEGDALGLVVFIGTEGESAAGETEYKLAQAIAGFLGKHMES